MVAGAVPCALEREGCKHSIQHRFLKLPCPGFEPKGRGFESPPGAPGKPRVSEIARLVVLHDDGWRRIATDFAWPRPCSMASNPLHTELRESHENSQLELVSEQGKQVYQRILDNHATHGFSV